jgi:catechol 2,3-dioxygenase-like lactoylglutathione lyase family enzyme
MDFSFDHVHLICKDVRGMAEYFERVFGGERILDDPDFHGAPNIVVRVGAAKIFCRGVRPGEKPGPSSGGSIMGLDHFSFTVEDTKEAAEFVRARGARFIREPGPSGLGGRWTAYIQAPEEVRVELSQRTI